MSPRSSLDHWSAGSLTGNDMTSSIDHVIALDQSGARKSAKRADFTTNFSLFTSLCVLFLRAVAGFLLEMKPPDLPVLHSVAISFSILVSEWFSQFLMVPLCVWLELLCLYWELVLKVTACSLVF